MLGTLVPGTRFSKVPVTFKARNTVYVCHVCIRDQSFNNFENDTMKLSANEAKLTGLCARNCGSIYASGQPSPVNQTGPDAFKTCSVSIVSPIKAR